MDEQKLTPELAERLINLLRDNPGVNMTIADIADETGLAAEDLAAYLEDLVERSVLEKDTTPDGLDVYRFPADYQRGTMAP